MVKKAQQRVRNKRLPDKAALPPPAMGTVTSVTASGSTQVTIVFAQPVQIVANKLPTTWVFGTGNHSITALVSATPTTYVFTVNGSVAASQAYSMPAMDPAARTSSGGFIAAKSGTLA